MSPNLDATPPPLFPDGLRRPASRRPVTVDPTALMMAAERRMIRLSLADELAGWEAYKRRKLVELNDWVSRWCRDHTVKLDDLDERGAPRVDRCTPEALAAWGDTLFRMASLMDVALEEHQAAMAILRGELEKRRAAAQAAEVLLPWMADGPAVTMATRHAATMFPRLDPVHPAVTEGTIVVEVDVTSVAPTPGRLVIDEPGLYDGITDEEYHGDPVPWGSVSSGGLRRMLPPKGNPELFAYERANPRPPRAVFEFGHAAHARVLGVGAQVVEVKADDWRKKATQDERDRIRDEGNVPLLTKDVEIVEAMATALRQHPMAAALLDPDRGDAEQSAFWVDPATGVWCRARFDWLPWTGRGPLLIGDLKTTDSVNPVHFARSVATFGYHQQRAHYEEAIRALGIHDDPVMLFIAIEKTPPFQVGVFELDAEAVRIGRERNRLALELYAECTETGVWPSGGEEIQLISLPRWAR